MVRKNYAAGSGAEARLHALYNPAFMIPSLVGVYYS